ncbi:MAG: tetratricopeptide repeat protein [Caldilineaceae bacterium]
MTGLASRKADALIAYLACKSQIYPRELLADFLWDDRTHSQSMGNLRVILNSIKNELPNLLTITRQTVSINPMTELWVDAVAFDTVMNPLLQAAMPPVPLSTSTIANLQKALELYQGEFLAGFYLRDAHQFEEWAAFERECYHISSVKAAQVLAQHYMFTRDHRQGTVAAQRWVQLDTFNEQAHSLLMQHLVYDGQRTSALDHYQAHLDKLGREGVERSAELEALYQQITRDELSTQIVEWQGQPVVVDTRSPVMPNNLPSSLTPLIGREQELSEIQSRLENPACRLLTITGLGGVGKTCLAIKAAHKLTTSATAARLFRDGIFLIRLERIALDQLLPSVIATTVNYTFQGTLDQTKQLLQYLHNRHLLLILDNFEHLLSQSSLLHEILEQAPHVKLLVTTRERLEFMGEWLFPIKGLPYPQGQGNEKAEKLTPATRAIDAIAWHEYPAVKLFIHTAQAILPSFVPTEEEAPILQICQTVEGLPLGIQLAAAATYVHSCQQIADSFQRNLDFVNTTMRNMPERHRSLRAAFENSWQLLSATEKTAFCSLAVFTNGFTEEQATIVADVTQDQLMTLLSKSLVQRAEEQPIDMQPQEDAQSTLAQSRYRYRIHPVLHQYAMQQLALSDGAETLLRHRHCLYFCRFAAEQESAIMGTNAAGVAAVLALEMENIRAGWRYALTHCFSDLLQAMLPALLRFYVLRGFLQDALSLLGITIGEVQKWLQATASPQQQWQTLLAYLFAYQAEVYTELGQYDAALFAGQKATEHAKHGKDTKAEAFSYLHWGIALNCQGNYQLAKGKLNTCLQLAQQAEFGLIEATAHRYLGVNSFYQGDYVAGRLHHESAIRLYQQHGDLTDELRTYHSLAMLYFYTGDYLQARRHYDRCRTAYKEIGDRPSLSLTLNNLGAVSSHLGDYERALRYFEDALVIRRQIGDRQMEGLILANMGLLVHQMNNNRLALEYCTQALEVSIEIGERDTEAYARTCFGHALLEMGRIADAITNYEQAVQVRKGNGQPTQMLEPLAGLVRAHLRLRNTDQALHYVEEILPNLDHHTYAGIVELLRIYLTCYRVLYLVEDERASGVLTLGYKILQERAAKISDKTVRQGYLETIIAHRELLTEYETQNAAGNITGNTIEIFAK